MKITKGVVGQILPDDHMPIDEYGIRADVCIDMNSPVGRNNPGQLYETGTTRILEFGRREVIRVRDTKGPAAAFDTIVDLYNDFNPKYAEIVKETHPTPEAKKALVEETITDGPRVWIPPFLDTFTPTKDDPWNALRNIRRIADKWGVKPSRVRYKSPQADGSVKEFVTEQAFSIGSKYWLHLHKLPEIFATGPAAVNHMGIPTKASSDAKHFPVIQSPYKFGEDEIRMMALDCPTDWVTRFQSLLSNSPVGVTATIRAYMLAKHPSRIKLIPISNGELMRTNAAANLIHSITATLGVETKATKLDDLALAAMEELTANDAGASVLWDADTETKSSTLEDAEVKRQRLATGRREKIEKMFGGEDDDETLDEDIEAEPLEPDAVLEIVEEEQEREAENEVE